MDQVYEVYTVGTAPEWDGERERARGKKDTELRRSTRAAPFTEWHQFQIGEVGRGESRCCDAVRLSHKKVVSQEVGGRAALCLVGGIQIIQSLVQQFELYALPDLTSLPPFFFSLLFADDFTLLTHVLARLSAQLVEARSYCCCAPLPGPS